MAERSWVWVRGTLVHEAMVCDGWAVRYTVPPNVKYADRVERAQNMARPLAHRSHAAGWGVTSRVPSDVEPACPLVSPR